MINVIRPIFLLCCFIFLEGCNGSVNANKGQVGKSNDQKEFTIPQIPDSLDTQQQRLEFIVDHYWDNFDFADKSLIGNAEITEQAFADFLYMLPNSSEPLMKRGVEALMSRAAVNKEMFLHFMELSEKYIYDPNSPYRDNDLYIIVLQTVLGSGILDENEMIRPKHQLDVSLKNPLGGVATDFSITLKNGRKIRLKSIKTEYTLLFFNNPDCNECAQVKQQMADSKIINKMLDEKSRLTILSVYPDEDIELWKNTSYDKRWISGYDEGQVLSNEFLYDLRAIPTLYLLSPDKRVIMRDVPFSQIEAHFERLK